MKKTYSFDGNQLASHELEDFSVIIRDPDYTDFSLEVPMPYPGEEAIGFNEALFELLLGALITREVPISALSLSGLHAAQKHALMEALGQEACKLLSLDLSFNAINVDEAEVLADILEGEHCQLRTLNLQDNNLGNRGVLALEETLKSPTCKLEVLNLSGNDIGVKGALALARALQSPHSKIRCLLLHYNAVADKGTRALAHALKSPDCPLEILILSDNFIKKGGLIALASALMNEHCQIKRLDISDNPLEEKKFKIFAAALRSPSCPLIDLKLDYDTDGSERLLLRAVACNPNIIFLNGESTQHYQGARTLADQILQGQLLDLKDLPVFRSQLKAIHWLLRLENDSFSLSEDPLQSLLAVERYLGFFSKRSVNRGPQSPALESPKEAYQTFFRGLSQRHQQVLSGLEEHLLFYLKRQSGNMVSVLPCNVLCSMAQAFSDVYQSQATLGLFFRKNQSALANLLELVQLRAQDLSHLLIGLILRASDVKEIAFEEAKQSLEQTFCLIRLLLSVKQQEAYKTTFEAIRHLSESQLERAALFHGAIQWLDASVDALSLGPLALGSSLEPFKAEIIRPINLSHEKRGYGRIAVNGTVDGGYGLLGMIRSDAHRLLRDNIPSVQIFLEPRVRACLSKESFYQYLLEKSYISRDVSWASIQASTPQYAKHRGIVSAFLDFDVLEQRVEAGWAHPAVLQALGHLCKIDIYSWQLGEEESLIPHRQRVPIGTLKQGVGRVLGRRDLLFVDGRIERLSFEGGFPLDTEPCYPLCPYPSNTTLGSTLGDRLSAAREALSAQVQTEEGSVGDPNMIQMLRIDRGLGTHSEGLRADSVPRP